MSKSATIQIGHRGHRKGRGALSETTKLKNVINFFERQTRPQSQKLSFDIHTDNFKSFFLNPPAPKEGQELTV